MAEPLSQRMAIGAVIRRRRQELGWTQATLASRAGFGSPSTIIGYERGQHVDWLGHLRSLRSLAAIAAALGTTISVLLGEAGVPDKVISRLTLALVLDARRKGSDGD
jgi:transcriptional regulator with XRE-family HTH domain